MTITLHDKEDVENCEFCEAKFIATDKNIIEDVEGDIYTVCGKCINEIKEEE